MMRWLLFLPVLAAAPCLGAEPWQALTKDNGLPANEVQFIKQDALGTVWIGTRGGLVQYEGSQVQPGGVTGEVWDVVRLSADAYWVGTSSGAVLVRGTQQQTFLEGTTVAPLVPLTRSLILALSKNLATEVSTLVAFRGKDWEPVPLLAKQRATDIERLSDGTVWVSVEGRGVYVLDPKTGLEKAAHHHARQNVTTTFQDSKGRVWCGLWGRGLAVYENAAWSSHLADKEIYPFAIREDRDGTIWVATDQTGLWRYDGKRWTNDLKDEGAVNLLETMPDGRVWISTQATGGLRYWDGKTWQVSLPGPLPIRCLTRTRDGKLLAGSVHDGLHVRTHHDTH